MVLKQKSKRKRNNLPEGAFHKFGVRLSHHRHSGRHLPLRYTSYAALFFLIVSTFLVVLFAAQQVKAYEQIFQGSINLGGFSQGPPPVVPAVINTSENNVYQQSIVSVTGSCKPDLFVEIQRNNIVAGGTVCSRDGNFSLHIQLLPGKNIVVARVHDPFGRYAPDSKPAIFWYRPAQIFVPGPLVLQTKADQDGLMVGQPLILEYQISGGQLPYAVSIDWGDGSQNDVWAKTGDGSYQARHDYKKQGLFYINIVAADVNGQTAFIQSVIAMHSDRQTKSLLSSCLNSASPEDACTPPSSLVDWLSWMWPVLVVAALMTTSFWAGEKIMFTDFFKKLRRTRK